jgi:hypothetical protein
MFDTNLTALVKSQSFYIACFYGKWLTDSKFKNLRSSTGNGDLTLKMLTESCQCS